MAKCLLCNMKHKDPRCGEFIQKGKIVVHEFCLYLSSALLTNGNDDNGLYGFLPEDIYAESKRASKLHCVYCRKPYANIGCCKAKCQHSFHALCGFENGCENQFAGTFRSYCKEHVHKRLRKGPPLNEICCICQDTLKEHGKKYHHVDFIEAPCCRNGWFHRSCLQGFARSAGYFFKCPLCNDNKKFRDEMPYRGVFVPERDAAWELEPNAFSDLLVRPSKCVIETCKHRKGRNAHDDPRDPLLICETCGAVAVHQNCLPSEKSDFICKDCEKVTERLTRNEDSGRESLAPIVLDHDDEDEEIDVCTVSDSEDDEDFLEKAFTRPPKPPALSEKVDLDQLSSLQENSNDSINVNTSIGSNSVEKRFHYDSSEESEDSEIVCLAIRRNRMCIKTYNLRDTDESDACTSPLQQDKNIKIRTDSTDESSESFVLKRKKNTTLVIDSTSEDSDEFSSSTDDPIAAKRRKTLPTDVSSKTRTRNLQNATNCNTTSSNKNIKKTDSYEDFSANLNPNDENQRSEHKQNASCIAHRTRRKSANNTDRERTEKFSPQKLNKKYQVTEKQRTSSSSSSESSSSSSSESSSLGYSSTADATESSSSSFPHASTKYRQHSATHSLKSSSSSSLSSSESSSNDASLSASSTNSRNHFLDISCIANRTRCRKSNRYSQILQRLNEDDET